MQQLNNKNYADLFTYLKSHYAASSWVGHIEFASWLTNKYKPKVIVDLGVDYGHSTFSLASELTDDSKMYGIDSFEGDQYSGFRNTYNTVIKAHKFFLNRGLLQKDNIEFIKGQFNDVYKVFESRSTKINILHLDGSRAYSDVKNDYELWSKLLDEDGIVLIHNVYTFPNETGKYFNEIDLPKTKIDNSAGLGIVCKNAKIIDEINDQWVNKLKVHDGHLSHDDYPDIRIKKFLL